MKDTKKSRKYADVTLEDNKLARNFSNLFIGT